ncbi:type IV inositol polyphosphate 5-phosphatase 11 isoform X1 [Typha angustifolia]|uniref:type IV inositol polyphosphate 5-phosphatase 11 isoform X1 n=1 Tax=Typha angustifolia TaxID=59011 RepID=UPI003C2E96F3
MCLCVCVCVCVYAYRKRVEEVDGQRLDGVGDNQQLREGINRVGLEKVCGFWNSSAVCVCVVTWNMNGKASSQDLVQLIGRDRRFHLLAVGLQEVPRVHNDNVATLLQEALVDTHSLLGESTMQSLQLYVFGPKNMELEAKEMRIDKHAVGGCGGLIGRKKGAVGIYLVMNGIRVVFITCHLSAHAHNVEERNSQCRHISHAMFSKAMGYPYETPSHLTVWLGDLNYRIHGIGTLPARSLIHKNLHNMLISKDQLLQEAERGEVFNGYCEGTLSFKPTYKYNVGSSNYDTSYKIRVPSWTDRVLFKIDATSGLDAVLHSYESVDQIHSSDHKPVKAHLCLKLNNM